MDYSTNAHTLFGNLTFQPSERLQLFSTTMWHKGSGGIEAGTLGLDANTLPQQPLGLNYTLLSETMHTFSSIEIQRFTQSLGFNWKAGDRLLLLGNAEYDDYDDRDPYLFTVDGRHFLFQIGVMLTY